MERQRFSPARVTRRSFLGGAAGAAVGAYGLSLGLPRKAAARTQVLTFQTWSDYTPASDVMLKKQTRAYNKQTKGAEIELEFISLNDRPAKIAAAIEAGAGPDIVVFWFGEARLYEDSLRTVDDLCDRLSSKLGDWSPAIKSANYMNGH